MAHRHQVRSSSYPYLTIRVSLRAGEHVAEALVDTGFTGDLVLPTGLLGGSLGLPDAAIDWELADGSTITAPAYIGSLEIIGLPPVPATVTVLGGEHILGRGVIDRFRVIFEHGRELIVEP